MTEREERRADKKRPVRIIATCPLCGGTPTDHALIGCPPRDYCRHGVYVGGSGVDYMCGACENGED